jgi:hypothetical protein
MMRRKERKSEEQGLMGIMVTIRTSTVETEALKGCRPNLIFSSHSAPSQLGSTF